MNGVEVLDYETLASRGYSSLTGRLCHIKHVVTYSGIHASASHAPAFLAVSLRL